MFKLSDYDYVLDEKLIAQEPAIKRDLSKLLRLNRFNGSVSHHVFNDIQDFLSSKDVLVINNTRVIPGRLIGRKATGGRVELLIVDFADAEASPKEFTCQCLVRSSKAPRPGTTVLFDDKLHAKIFEGQNGIYAVTFYHQGDFEKALERIGKVPLPPYIKRKASDVGFDDQANYQTVYASQDGAVAAPTAGLHFTQALMKSLKKKGVTVAELTLHVSYGTFLPVRVSDIRQHRMFAERFSISAETAASIRQVKSAGGRVVAVGTTAVRTLEFAADDEGNLTQQKGSCDLFIYPGYRFKLVDAMITNFHLPQSTLLMLVSAFAGRENVLNAYAEAIKEKYRFYSYGDAMLID